MPINKLILREWINIKVKSLEQKHKNTDSTFEISEWYGKLAVLDELYDDFNLEEVQDEEIIYHNNY